MKILKQIINIGIDDTVPEFEMRRIRLANMLTLAPLFIYFLLIVIAIVYDLPVVLWMTVAASFINLSGLWLSSIKRYTLARSVPLIFNSIFIALVHDIFDFGEPFFLFYYPILIAYASYLRFKSERQNILLAFSITALTILFCIFFPRHTFYSITTSDTLIAGISYLVKATSVLLFSVFIILMVHFNNTVEEILREVIDKTNRQADELKLANAKANLATEAKNNFLSNMSHELRTPLNGIIGSVNLLMDARSPKDEKQNLEILKYSSEHMLTLVNDVLDFSKIDSGNMHLHPQSCNLKMLCDETVTLFEQEFKAKQLAFEYTIDEALNENYITDTTRLKQVLINLLSNAGKFTEKGTIVFTVEKNTDNSSSTSVSFTVKDTGIGIDPSMHHHIFESFSQLDASSSRKQSGTGLGLSISSNLVQMMGGVLQLASETGKGSSFYFTLNFQKDDEQKTIIKNKIDAELFPLHNLKVLLAEDNPISMLIAKKFLTNWKVSLTTAVNGAELIEQVSAADFDVLLVDLDMPVIDGYQAVEHIRTTNKKVPAIAFTAAAFENIHQYLIEKGFTGYLQKPFRPEDLYQNIAKYHAVS